MVSVGLLELGREEGWSDEEVVGRVLAGEKPLYELLMRRYNQRLYRIARAILHDDGEAEDVMQDAYVRAYQHLAQFGGRAKFSTWLTRIAMHEAWARSARRARFQHLESEEAKDDRLTLAVSSERSPEQSAYDQELRGVLEEAILSLPDEYRVVLMLRDVEEMSTDEAADCLNLTQENVKVRLHRARAALREELFARMGARTAQSFQFHAPRCDRVVENVFRILNLSQPDSEFPPAI